MYRQETMQSLTYQALSRVKDPNGIEESTVYAIGIRYDEMMGIVTWGEGRKELCEYLKVSGAEAEHIEAEYFRTGHDADYLKSIYYVGYENLLEHFSGTEEDGFSDTSEVPDTKTQKSILWGHTKNRIMAKPVVLATKRAHSMIETLKNHTVGRSLVSNESYSSEHVLSNKTQCKYESGPELNRSDKYSKTDNLTTPTSDIYNETVDLDNIGSVEYSYSDKIIPDQSIVTDHKYKMKSLEAFFAGELHTVLKPVTDRMDILRELCYRWNAYATQNDDGNGYCKQDGDLSDELLQRHLDGRHPIDLWATVVTQETMVMLC